ncbi:MAG: MFS transporter [Dermatophilaceae bacterium]
MTGYVEVRVTGKIILTVRTLVNSREAPEALPLRREPDFRRLWAGQAVSVLGSEVTTFALPVLAVVTLGVGAGELSLLRTLEFVPFVLLTLPAGLWLDRHRPRPAMLAANAVRAVAIGGVALAGLFGALHISWLYAAVLVLGAATVVFDVAYLSYLPALVRRDQLVEGNSHLAVTDSAAQVGGPGLAGLLIQTISAPAALLVDAASYLVSLLTLSRIRTPDRPPRAHTDERVGLRRQVAEGLRVVTVDRYLRVICLEAFTYNLFTQFGATLVVLYALNDLGLSAGQLGVYLALGGLGAVAGSALTPLVIRAIGFGPAFIGGTALACAAPVLVPIATPTTDLAGVLIALSSLLTGLGVTVSVIGSVTLRQSIAPEHLLGRVNAVMRLASYSALPIGALLAGAIASATTVRTALFVGAAGLALPVLILVLSPVPRLRTSFDAEPAGDTAVAPQQRS